MKAMVDDYIRTDCGPRRVISASEEHGYQLENGAVLADADISIDDVLLTSEVTG